MARLYRYVNSSRKSGYFIIGDDGNATFQLTSTAQKLFEELGYEPPTRPEGQGPQIPSELHWTLFEIGWIYTGENDTSPIEDGNLLTRENEDVAMSDEIISKIKQFIKERDGKEVRKLAERLNLEPEKDRLATLDKEKQRALEDYVYGFMDGALTETEDEDVKSIDVLYQDLGSNIGMLTVFVESIGDKPNCRHSISANSESREIGMVTATEASPNWEERGRLDRHRGYIFDAISTISADSKMNHNFDYIELKGGEIYKTSFDVDINMPD